MGSRLASCLLLWGFKTDGWPPVPISKPSPGPRAPWIELRLALAMLRQWFCGPCFLCHACYACHCPTCQLFSSMVSPTVSNALLEFVPTNARTTLLYRTLDTCGDAAASPCSRRRPGHKIGCRIFCGGSLALSAQYLPHCLRKRDNNKQTFCRQRARQNLRKPCYDFSFLLLIRFMPTPRKQSRGVGGTRAIAHSIKKSGDAGPLDWSS